MSKTEIIDKMQVSFSDSKYSELIQSTDFPSVGYSGNPPFFACSSDCPNGCETGCSSGSCHGGCMSGCSSGRKSSCCTSSCK